MTHETTSGALARALGVAPHPDLCPGITCEFDASDVARLRGLRDDLEEAHPDLAAILHRHIHMVEHARALLRADHGPATCVSGCPQGICPHPDLSVWSDYLADVVPRLYDGAPTADKPRAEAVLRTVVKAAFLDLCTTMATNGAAMPWADGRPDLAERRRRVLPALATNRLIHEGDIDAAARVIADCVTWALRADTLCVYVVDRSRRLRPLAPRDAPDGNGHDGAREMPPGLDEAGAHRAILYPGAGNGHAPQANALAAPVRALGRLAAVLWVETGDHARAWAPEERAFLEDVARLLGVAFENRRREEARHLLHLHSAALEALPMPSLALDCLGRVVWVNEACVRYTGYARGDLIHGSVRQLRPRFPDGQGLAEVGRHLQAGRAWRGRVALRRFGGVWVEFAVSLVPIFNVHDEFTHVIATALELAEAGRADPVPFALRNPIPPADAP